MSSLLRSYKNEQRLWPISDPDQILTLLEPQFPGLWNKGHETWEVSTYQGGRAKLHQEAKVSVPTEET